MGGEIVKWADRAMFEAKPMQRDELGRVVPQVHLLWATPDPLGAIAAACRMYKGIPTYDLSDITDDERKMYWEESFKSHLRAPHEFVKFHFFIEGVTRSHTHQMVRQRTAVFAQESLRFAVKEGFANEIPLPPALLGANDDLIGIWRKACEDMEQAYTVLVNNGVPAEDARGLLPHAVTTRLNYCTDLRALLEHAGNRLCTQAQFEWRYMFVGIMKAIKNYQGPHSVAVSNDGGSWGSYPSEWQFELLGTPQAETWSPICYKTGKCEFEAIFDRQCAIRSRVKAFAAAGIPSSRWADGVHRGLEDPADHIEGIDPREWLTDPTAGRRD